MSCEGRGGCEGLRTVFVEMQKETQSSQPGGGRGGDGGERK